MRRARNMLKIGNIDWFKVLCCEAAAIEADYNVAIEIEKATSLEVGRLIADNLEAIGLEKPNVAKIAGQAAFWIRKLKPLRISASSPNYLGTVNELAALRIGIAICNTYKDDNSKCGKITLPPRIFRDWVNSFRYHSHSPHSSMISFELLMCAE